MAVTYITRIYATIDKSVDYIIRDKVVLTGEEMKSVLKKEALESANSYIENALDYIGKDKSLTDEERKLEIRKTLTNTLNCSYENSKSEFEIVRDMYKSENGRGKEKKEILGYHVWQSFEENIDQKLSNEIGMKLANELFGDFQCVVSTHINTEHTHNHIVFNATSLNGGKYHLNTANTKKIREVSDRLCEEYGLSVLQATKDMNLKWYKDGKGEWKCFEPTDRNREKRKGEFSKTTDYRNYEAYERSKDYKESNCKTIRRDIDKFIPLSKSLDELIQNLKGIGYEIKDLKTNGERLKFISFKAPSQDKFTRGNANTLGLEYTRENIEKRITESNKKLNLKETEEVVLSSDNSEQNNSRHRKPVYKYGEIDIDKLDEERKIKYSQQRQQWVYIPRNDVERYIIVDTKILNRNLEELYKKASASPTFEKKSYKGKGAKTQYHIDRINENLRALEFIDNKNLKSFEQINTTVQSLYQKRNEVNNEFAKIRDLLKEMNKEIVLIKQYNTLKLSIEENKTNVDYVSFEMQGETSLLKQYEEILKAKKLLTPTEQADRISKFDKFTARFMELGKAYESIKNMIADYDRTVYVINRIDRDSDRRYSADIKSYYDTRSANKSSNDRSK